MTNPKIDFIIKHCGGDSLSHVLIALQKIEKRDELFSLSSDGWIRCNRDIAGQWTWFDDEQFFWQFLKDNKEAKLADQSEETLVALVDILGGEDE